MKTSPWTTWRADDYYRDYYGADVKPDEREAIRFQLEFLRRSGRTFSSAVEYGCGPTLHRASSGGPLSLLHPVAGRSKGRQ